MGFESVPMLHANHRVRQTNNKAPFTRLSTSLKERKGTYPQDISHLTRLCAMGASWSRLTP